MLPTTHYSIPPDLPRLPLREAASHKGNFGRCLLVGGSTGMAGAIALAGMSCLRSGAGLTRLGVPEAVLATVAGFEPCYTLTPLACDAAGRLGVASLPAILAEAALADVVALGPGLGRSPELTQLVQQLYQQLDKPLVVDADGLFALAQAYDPSNAQQPLAWPRPAAPRILTPHAGEFARLVNLSASASREAQIAAATTFAQQTGTIVLLKGNKTFITDGQRQAFNPTGNPGMATGGSGDVLTGIITALLGQGLAPYAAAQLGAFVHGLAGDLAAAEVGQVSLIATDLIRFLPQAFLAVGYSESSSLSSSS